LWPRSGERINRRYRLGDRPDGRRRAGVLPHAVQAALHVRDPGGGEDEVGEDRDPAVDRLLAGQVLCGDDALVRAEEAHDRGDDD
jgi:hypothetical protein